MSLAKLLETFYNERHFGLEWLDKAQCKGVSTDIFYPTVGDLATVRKARSICKACLVSSECLEYALSNKIQEGIFGGKTSIERRRLAWKRRAQGN